MRGAKQGEQVLYEVWRRPNIDGAAAVQIVTKDIDDRSVARSIRDSCQKDHDRGSEMVGHARTQVYEMVQVNIYKEIVES